MRISDWSSDVCSSDLGLPAVGAIEHLHHMLAGGAGPVARRIFRVAAAGQAFDPRMMVGRVKERHRITVTPAARTAIEHPVHIRAIAVIGPALHQVDRKSTRLNSSH